MSENLLNKFLTRRVSSSKLDNLEAHVFARINNQKYHRTANDYSWAYLVFNRGALVSLAISLFIGAGLGVKSSTSEYKKYQTSKSLSLDIFSSDNPHLIDNKISMNYER